MNHNGVQEMNKPTEHGPIEELRMSRAQPGVALLGLLMGGYVPVESFALVHRVGGLSVQQQVLVGACLAYSSLSVWQWARAAQGSVWKATCWVVLLEGGMVAAGIPWLSWIALVYLLFINATHTAAGLVARDRARVRLVDDQLADDDVAPPKLEAPSAARRVDLSRAAAHDALYRRAVELITRAGSCSISALQRDLGVGYNRAAKLVERMEGDGLVGPAQAGRRAVLESSRAQHGAAVPASQLSHACGGG
jgi:hypothetical protein